MAPSPDSPSTNNCDSDLEDVIQAFASLSKLEDFNRVGAKVRPISANKNKIVCELKLEPEHLNSKGTLHGGFTASLCDIITARAVGVTVKSVGMASVELAVSYLLPAKIGDTLTIEATVLKIGRSIAFTECEFRRQSDNKICAKGKYTIHLAQPPTDGNLVQI